MTYLSSPQNSENSVDPLTQLSSVPLRLVTEKREDVPGRPGVYRIRNIRNGKAYIGSAQNIRFRARRHIRDLKSGKHYNKHLLRAYHKYGEDAFVFDVLELCLEKENTKREQTHLDVNRKVRLLYNVAPTANSPLGRKLSMSARRKIAESNRRRKLSDETKRQISKSLTGRKLPPAVAKSRSDTLRDCFKKIEVVERHREGCRRCAIRRWDKVDRTQPFKLKLFNGAQFEGTSLFDFCKSRGLDFATMRGVVEGRFKHHKGFHLPSTPLLEYEATSPDGTKHKVFNMLGFCKTRGLSADNLRRVAQGAYKQHKGWTCRIVDHNPALQAALGASVNLES